MSDVTLWCRVYGLGLTFRVQIARDAYVDTLKETIVDSHKALDPRFNVNPAGVTLYLAKKKDGTWLTDDDDLDVLLKRGRPQQDAEDDFVEMIPNWKLSKNAYFGRRFQLEEDGDDAEDKEEAKIHILVELPVFETVATAHDSVWRVRGWVSEALSAKGIRRRLYQLAAQCLGYYDPTRRSGDDGDCAFWYESTTLCIQVLFDDRRDALTFDRALVDDPVEKFSPLSGHAVTTEYEAVVEVPRTTRLRPIYLTDYDPHESESSGSDAMSSTSTASLVDPSHDLFLYQRIEHEKFFVPYGKAESCHLVSKRQCLATKADLGTYADDPNNRIPLSRGLHGFYKGLSCDFPIFTMRPGAVDERPSIENRYKVEVFVTVYDANCQELVFSRLKDGSTPTEDPLTMKTVVYVEDPTAFCFCLNWRHREIQDEWTW